MLSSSSTLWGVRECRRAFSQALLDALGDRPPGAVCADCQRRAQTNPLRIFDCKVPADQSIIDALPHSEDYLCTDCREHFDAVKRMLQAYALDYRVSHRLVRGLDYYTRTTFEILGHGIGAQSAVLGGGRYDNLIKQLGGSGPGGYRVCGRTGAARAGDAGVGGRGWIGRRVRGGRG